MAFKSLLSLVFLVAETLAGVAVPALKPALIALAPRQASTACTIMPTVAFPDLCSANLNGATPTYAVMPPEGGAVAPAGPTPTCTMQPE